MANEYQILSAFRTWRDIARTKFSAEQLPTDEELIAAAESPEQLKPGGDYPALLVWATALRRVLGYVQVGTVHVIEQGSDAAMFTPDLDVEVEHVDDSQVSETEPEYEYAEVIEEPEPKIAPAPRQRSNRVKEAGNHRSTDAINATMDSDVRNWQNYFVHGGAYYLTSLSGLCEKASIKLFPRKLA